MVLDVDRCFSLPVFVMLALVFCLLWWMGKTGLMRAVGVPLALSAVSILMYTGMEVMVRRARPVVEHAIPANQLCAHRLAERHRCNDPVRAGCREVCAQCLWICR